MGVEEDLEDLKIAKENRIRREDADRDRQIYNPPLLDVDRTEPRRVRDRRIALIVKKARKKG